MAKSKTRSGLVTNEAPVLDCDRLQSLRSSVDPRVRFEKMEGRDYMVVPMVMLTEGVHAGSNGPLYYPAKELSKTPAVWNHKPVVVYHPTMNGSAISACEPTVISRRKVGLIMNTQWEAGDKKNPGKLKAEAWLETNRLKEVDDRVLKAVQNKKMMEVSTGLFTDNEPIDGTWNKEDYTYIARNYRPDHLAILPDEKGACSIADGAGLMRNSEMSHDELRQKLQELIKPAKTTDPNQPYTSVWVCDVYGKFFVYQMGSKHYKQDFTLSESGVSLTGQPVEVTRRQTYTTADGTVVNTEGADHMTKQKLVDALIANNATGWEEDDREHLMTLSAEDLKKMQPVINRVGGDTMTDGRNDDGDPDGELKNAKTKVAAKKAPSSGSAMNVSKEDPDDDEDEDEDTDDDGDGKKGKVPPQFQKNQAQSVEEFIANAPEGMRDVLQSMHRSHSQQKRQLVKAITANKANRFSDQYLASRSLEELQCLAELAAPQGTPKIPVRNNFAGMGEVGGETVTTNEEEALPIPVMNFAKRED